MHVYLIIHTTSYYRFNHFLDCTNCDFCSTRKMFSSWSHLHIIENTADMEDLVIFYETVSRELEVTIWDSFISSFRS